MKLVKESKQLIEDLADEGEVIYERLGIVQQVKVASNYHERIKEGKEEQVQYRLLNLLEKRTRGSLKVYKKNY